MKMNLKLSTTQALPTHPLPNAGEVWNCYIPPMPGHPAWLKGFRPAIVLGQDASGNWRVVAMTKTHRNLGPVLLSEETGLKYDSEVRVGELRTLPLHYFKVKDRATLSDDNFNTITTAVVTSLQLLAV